MEATKSVGSGMHDGSRSNSLTSMSSGSDSEGKKFVEKEKLTSNTSEDSGSMSDDYLWSKAEEPHGARRLEILAKYPQIKELYGPDPLLKYTILAVVLIQFTMCYYCQSFNSVQYVLAAYAIGGTANHMLMLGMHELAHNLAFKVPLHNRIMALIANLPLGVPSCATFRKYHLEHHRYQGWDGIDVDVPTRFESLFFTGKLRKAFFVFFQIFFYALRPVLVYPKPLGFWEITNWITSITFDLTVLYFGGVKRLGYLLLGSLLGTGFHPVAGHFISEHYVFQKHRSELKGGGEPETFSYYGFWNIFAFNVGYHNEHHDFPYVPGSRLPEVRKIATEYYDSFPQCESWIGVLWDFIMNDNIGGFSRVKRHPHQSQAAEVSSKKES